MEKLGFKPRLLGSSPFFMPTEMKRLSHGICTTLSLHHDFSGKRLKRPKYHSQAIVCVLGHIYSMESTKLRDHEAAWNVEMGWFLRLWLDRNAKFKTLWIVWCHLCEENTGKPIFANAEEISRVAYKKQVPRIFLKRELGTWIRERGKLCFSLQAFL